MVAQFLADEQGADGEVFVGLVLAGPGFDGLFRGGGGGEGVVVRAHAPGPP